MRRALAGILLGVVLSPALAALAAEAGGAPDHPEMVTYYLGLLLRGPKWTPAVTPEVQRLQEEHLAHMRNMHEQGKLVVAGPLADDGQIRGVVIYKGASLEEARAMAEADPMVKAGRLALEMHPWMVQKGVLP